MKKKLLLAFHDMRLGGIQRKIIDIIKYEQTHHPDTHIILCLRERQGIFLKQVPSYVEIIHPTFYTRRFNMLWFTLWLVKKIAQIRPTHIVSFMDLTAVPMSISLNILPFIRPTFTIGEDILTSKYVYTESFPSLRRFLIKYLYRRADSILVQTPIQKADLENIIYQGKPNSNIIASPNWLPLPFPPKRLQPYSSRDIDILFVGRLDDQKNIPMFIEIISLLIGKFPNLKVRLVGDGTQKKAIQKLIRLKKLNQNIKIIASTLNTQKFYNHAKIFLLTSNYEGFPLTLIEAISSGCIPITRNIPEIAQFFRSNPSRILFDTPHQAAKLLSKALKPDYSTIYLKPYLTRIVTAQQKHISAYVKFFSRPKSAK